MRVPLSFFRKKNRCFRDFAEGYWRSLELASNLIEASKTFTIKNTTTVS
jgi:hypothetical protein